MQVNHARITPKGELESFPVAISVHLQLKLFPGSLHWLEGYDSPGVTQPAHGRTVLTNVGSHVHNKIYCLGPHKTFSTRHG